MENKISNLTSLLFAPIVPIALVFIYMCINLCEIKLISMFGSFIGIYLLYKFINIIKNKYENLFHISIVCMDWFMLDIINITTHNSYQFLYPSVLETIAKNSVAIII